MSNNKTLTGIIGLIAAVALVLSSLSFFGTKSSTLGAGDLVNPTATAYINGISIGTPNGNSTVFQGWVPFSMTRGQNQASWKNNTGFTVYVDLARITTDGTASSSYAFSIGTSTSSTLTDAKPTATAPLFATLIDRYLVATSSVATTTNSIKNGGTNGRGLIPVANGQYLNVVFEQNDMTPGTCDGSICENATSSNRGFNVTGSFHYTY